MKKSRAHIVMSGSFKGTFVKSAAKTKARLLGVSGWIRNNTDGEMEVVLEGHREDLEDIANFLKNSPNDAAIYSFDLKWEEPTEEFTSFEIIPTTDFRVAISTNNK